MVCIDKWNPKIVPYAAILKTTFSNTFSWMKIYEFRSRFHWNLFISIQYLSISCLTNVYAYSKNKDLLYKRKGLQVTNTIINYQSSAEIASSKHTGRLWSLKKWIWNSFSAISYLWSTQDIALSLASPKLLIKFTYLLIMKHVKWSFIMGKDRSSITYDVSGI